MQIGEKIRKANKKKKKLQAGVGFCPSRSVCLFAEAALSSAGMEKKGIPPAVRAAHIIGAHEQGTTFELRSQGPHHKLARIQYSQGKEMEIL